MRRSAHDEASGPRDHGPHAHGFSPRSLESESLDGSVLPPGRTKVLYVVRHAESEENVQIYKFDRAVADFRHGIFPRFGDIKAASKLLSFNEDSPLSDLGEQQLIDVRDQLCNTGFHKRSGVQLVVHSTRQRAVRTCNALFGNRFPTIAVEDLVERLPFEKDGPFRDRLVRFRSWLAARDEDCIAIVGHGYFFQRMFRGLKTEPLGNVEVRKCAFHVESLRFGMPEMLYEPQCEDSSDSSGCCA
mmetsp:Transcript_112413/g.217789  ORF Transcript_112413/g.217789 Transcript_112413/m.217789 type:complete len:244 (-) Transcript_112413:86-817(-)